MTEWNRRQFLRMAALSTSAAAVGGFSLSACGGDDDADSGSDPSTGGDSGADSTIPSSSTEAGTTPRTGTLTIGNSEGCLLYTSDAADDLLCVDLGGRRIIK